MEQFVGQDEARKLGYSLDHFGGDHTWATYSNEHFIFLTVAKKEDGTMEARLFTMIKLVKLEIGPFSFPHKSFKEFEKQIRTILIVSREYV